MVRDDVFAAVKILLFVVIVLVFAARDVVLDLFAPRVLVVFVAERHEHDDPALRGGRFVVTW
jgi:hypothetical protein